MNQEPLTGTPSTNPNYWNYTDDVPKKKNNDSVYKDSGLTASQREERINSCIMDLSKPVERPPILLSCGYDFMNTFIPIMTEGNFSVISGLSKARKSFFKSAIVAAYTGADFGNIKGHREQKKYIIDVDTEQSAYDSQEVFKRNETMAGEYPNYIPVYLRGHSEPGERLDILTDIINKYSGNIGLIAIDGYADLIENFNDIEQSMSVINALMKWTAQEKCHITGVAHLNPSINAMPKPQGHLGSMVLRKSETVIFIERDPNDPINISNVTCAYSRNKPFEDFSFTVKNNLPEAI